MPTVPGARTTRVRPASCRHVEAPRHVRHVAPFRVLPSVAPRGWRVGSARIDHAQQEGRAWQRAPRRGLLSAEPTRHPRGTSGTATRITRKTPGVVSP